MKLDSEIKLVDPKDNLEIFESDDVENVVLDIEIYREKLHFEIAAPRSMVTLAEIVPLARNISDKITELVIQKNIQQGRRIPCSQGCSNCCSYLITASVAEVFSIADDVEKLTPSFYKYLQRNALLASKKILKNKPPKGFKYNKLKDISNWYKSLNLTCPFLFENNCSIYNSRPIACREYFIEGSPNACKGKRGSAKVINMPVSFANVLNDLCSELLDRTDTTIMLPLFQVWANENAYLNEKKFSAKYLVKKFVDILKREALKKSEKELLCAN